MGDDPRNRFDAIFPGTSTSIAFGAAGTLAAAALMTATSIVRVYADQNCFIRFDGVTATSADMFLPAGVIEYFGVEAPSATPRKVSAVRSTNSGTLYITEGG